MVISDLDNLHSAINAIYIIFYHNMTHNPIIVQSVLYIAWSHAV